MGSGGSVFRRRGLNSALALVTALTTFMVATPDVGFSQTAPPPLVVNATNDVDDEACDVSHCSLREAIVAANAGPGADVVEFAISGAGPHLISLDSVLPTLVDPITINGFSQAGSIPNSVSAPGPLNADIQIAIGTTASGSLFSFGPGSDDSRLSGVAIVEVGVGPAISISGGNDVVISGNYIGSTVDGSNAGSLSGDAIQIVAGLRTIVGGPNTGDRNLIGSSPGSGVISANPASSDTTVQGNVIGMNAALTAPLPNRNGVVVRNVNTQVFSNVIAGNTDNGVYAYVNGNPTEQTNISANLIGLPGFGNGEWGIRTDDGVTLTSVSSNTISHNGAGGVWIGGTSPTVAVLSANTFSNNAGLGIDLGALGVDANDTGDTDTGPNGLQNAPDIGSAINVPGAVEFSLTLDSAPNTTFTLEFFDSATCDPSGFGEGETWLGGQQVTTDALGIASVTSSISTNAPVTALTAVTATGQGTGSSEFSNCVAVPITLQNMIDATPDGEILDVPEGTYNELVTIDGGKTLRSLNPGSVIIDGSNLNGTVVTATGDFALEGIQITGGDGVSGGAVSLSAASTGTLTDVVVTGNTATSGAGVFVFAGGSLTITDSQFSSNAAISDGGAIHNRGTLTINGSTFDANTAESGAAVFNHSAAPLLTVNAPPNPCVRAADISSFAPTTVFSNNTATGEGGGIYNDSVVNIYDTLFTNNDAENGGALYEESGAGTITVGCSAFELNDAAVDGGAIGGEDSGLVVIEDSLFETNTAARWGGALADPFGGIAFDVSNSVFAGNSANDGGAIRSDFDLTISESDFVGNTATVVGGGVRWDGNVLTIDRSTFDGNTASEGGGAYIDGSEVAVVTNSTFSNNTATSSGTAGAGMVVVGDATILNSTFSGNIATLGAGAGLGAYGSATADVNHVSFVGNESTDRGAAFNGADTSVISIRNSLAAGNSNGTGGPSCSNFVSLGYNVLGGNPSECDLAGTDITGNALVGSLADNTGPTLTHALQAESPAIDAADPGTLEIELVDAILQSQLQINSAARASGNSLILTPSSNWNVGSAYASSQSGSAFDLTKSFSTTFDFQITPPFDQSFGSGDGLAFAISPLATFVGEPGGRLGVAADPSPGIVSVSFKSFQGNIAGINVGGVSDGNTVVSDVAAPIPGNIDDGHPWTVWIDYFADTNLLEVRIATDGASPGRPGRPDIPLLSHTVDIAVQVGETGYYGFGSATASAFATHTVTDWELYTQTCPSTDQRGVSRPNGSACDIGAFESEFTTIPTELTVQISGVGADPGVTSSLIPIEDLNVGTFFGASEGPSSTQLGAIQLGAIQLGAIQLGAIGLADAAGHMTIGSIIDAAAELSAIPTILDEITLVDVPVVGGWEPILAGTTLAGRQTYTITLQQVINVVSDLNVLRNLRIADSGITASQLGAIQLGAIQLGAIQLGAIQLGAIQLGAIGGQLATLCDGDLDCSPTGLDIDPTESSTYDGYSIMALTLMGVDLDFAQLGAIQLGAIHNSPQGTQLGAIQLGAIQLGAIQLGAIGANAATIGNTQLGAIQLGAIQLGAIQLGAIDGSPGGTPGIVADLCDSGLNCAELGIDTDAIVGNELDGYSMLALGAMGADLLSTQLGAIQLGAIQLGAIGDLKNTQLGAIQLGAIQLGAIAPADTQLGAIQLGAIQLGAIQLGAIDWNNPVFAQLGAIQLGAIQLGAIATSTQLGAIQLGAIQLGAITNPSSIISCGSLAGGCSGNGSMTLLELQQLGLILPAATLADLAGAIDDVPLSDLLGSGFDIVALVGAATLLDLLPETTIADLPPDLTLGQLAELWVGMPVFELLLALLNPGELGWEDVDPAVLAAQHPFNSDWSVTFNMSGEPGQVPGAEFPFSAEVAVALPSGVSYVAGSAKLNSSTLNNPEIDGSTLRWILDGVLLNDTDVVEMTLATSFTVDTTTPVTATVNTLGYTASDSLPAFLTDLEPNDTFAQADLRAPITSDVIVLGRVDTPGDVDIFKVEVPPGGTIEAYLNPGGTDLDLVLFEEVRFTDGELRGSPERIVDGSLDPTIGIDPAEQDQESLADIANTDLAPVFKASLHRSSANESIVTPPLRNGGTYYLQTTSYNGATSDSVYVERIRVINPPSSSPCAARQLGDPSSWGAPSLPSGEGIETLYLMNTGLFRDTFGDTETDAVLAAIAGVQGVPGTPTGVVVPVEGDAAVAAAYAAWLGASGNCSVDAANNVATAIAELVDSYRGPDSTVQNIVIVGGDDQIPFFRLEDQGIVANEREYRTTFTGNNPLVASLAGGMVLSDAPYSDANPLYVQEGDREVFIPQLPTGRLVDQPVEIVAALDQFVASSGLLDTATDPAEPSPSARVLGYDFLADSSQTIADELMRQGFDVSATITETWTKTQLQAAMDSGAAIINANAHYDHTAALPAAGNLSNTFTDLYTIADLEDEPTAAYAGSIIFTMGCHSGLNAPDSYLAAGDPALEWAQALLVRQAVYVGNTGFGYGDSDFEAYSEELMSLFAEGIGTSNTVGEAFVAAQQTLAGKTAKWSPYHDKSQMEATLYGLPFYKLHADDIIPLPNPTVDPTGVLGGLVTASVLVAPSAPPNTADVFSDTPITQVATDDGSYLVVDDVLAVPFRPVQPLHIVPVTPPSLDGIHATGAIIEGGTTTDLLDFDVLYARPILYNELAEPETETTGAFPNALQAVTSFETPRGRVDQLLLSRGRYFPSSRTQQRWNEMRLTVYYAPDSVTDITPPNIDRTSAVEVSAGRVVFQVEASGGGGIERVLVLYKAKGANGAWDSLELAELSGTWSGVATPSTPAQSLDFFVQVLGSNGQVSTSTDKAEMHKVQPPGPPTIQLTGTLGNSNIYKSAVLVALTPPANASAAPLEYSVDGGTTFTTYGSPFVVLTSSTVVARPKSAVGSSTTKIIAIDRVAPEVNLAAPTAGIVVERDSALKLRFTCSDADSGIAKCRGTVLNGGLLDTSVEGPHVAQVTGTDKAGNTTKVLVPYTVLPEAVLQLTADATVVTVGTPVNFSVVYTGEDEHQVSWDFGDDSTADPTPQAGGPGTATHIYAATGVYPVTVTVTHQAGLVQTTMLKYVVVYDPSEGFVTGGGWIQSPAGAYTPSNPLDADLIGKAEFGFVSKYKKGATVPTGNTAFEFAAADFEFHSTSYQWLVVQGFTKASYKGVGIIEGWQGEYKFRVTVRDADGSSFLEDSFRIKIWTELGDGSEVVIYDNGHGIDPDSEGGGATALGGGSIKIHVPKGKAK